MLMEYGQSIQAATNISLDLDERPMPKGPMFPRWELSFAVSSPQLTGASQAASTKGTRRRSQYLGCSPESWAAVRSNCVLVMILACCAEAVHLHCASSAPPLHSSRRAPPLIVSSLAQPVCLHDPHPQIPTHSIDLIFGPTLIHTCTSFICSEWLSFYYCTNL